MDRILIIEDEENLRKSIAEFLEIEGFKCLEAADGSEGIEIARTELPDIIICDIKMPGINGHEVLTELRRDSRTSTIPFIFLTALVNKQDFRRGMELGADDYITKPFLTNDLLNAVKTRLQKSQAHADRFQDLRKSLIASIPHELNTPLVSIIGYAQLLMDRYKDNKDPAIMEYSKSIYDAGLRLNKMIQNFIVYTKLKLASGESVFKIEFQADPALITLPLIKTIAENVAVKYKRSSDLSVDGIDARITISTAEFNIILEELVDNAFKFSGLGKPVTINTNIDGNQYIIIIKDNGRGMKAEQLKKIDAYVQFEREKYEQQGMGLGLTIAQKLVEMYGGKFDINSTYGSSTEIKISFPVIKESGKSVDE